MALYTGKALGKLTGLSAGEIGAMRKAGVIEYETGDLYRAEDAIPKIVRHLKSGERKEETADYATERALLMRSKRIEQEYETRLKAGELHEAKDVEQVVTTMLLNFRSRIMAMPATLAQRLAKENDTTAVFNALKEATDDALNELSDYDRLFADDSGKD